MKKEQLNIINVSPIIMIDKEEEKMWALASETDSYKCIETGEVRLGTAYEMPEDGNDWKVDFEHYRIRACNGEVFGYPLPAQNDDEGNIIGFKVLPKYPWTYDYGVD